MGLTLNRLKSLVKDFYIDELEKLSSNLDIIIEQRKKKEDESRVKNQKKIQKIEEIKSLLAQQGLSAADLIGDPLNCISNPIKVKKKIPPKYQLVDLDGTNHKWTGRGIAPKVFQQYFECGHSKESCLIIKNVTL